MSQKPATAATTTSRNSTTRNGAAPTSTAAAGAAAAAATSNSNPKTTTNNNNNNSNPQQQQRRSHHHHHRKHHAKSNHHHNNNSNNNSHNKNGQDPSAPTSKTAPSILWYNAQQQQHERYEDSFHSHATPCCALIRAAALDILPENNHGPEGETTTLQQQQQTTLLGRLVRQYLLDQRKKQQQQQQQQPKITAAVVTKEEDDDDNNVEDGNMTAAAAAAKKKRKKKKKKPKPSNNNNNSTANASGDDEDTPATVTTANTNTMAKNENGSVAVAASTTAKEDSARLVSQFAANDDDDDEGLVDHCLDSILTSPPTSDLSVPSNRTLESFLTFLAQRLSQPPPPPPPPSQPPQRNTSEENEPTTTTGGGSKRKKKNSNTAAAAAASSSSSSSLAPSYQQRATSFDPSRSFLLSIETISIICQSIQCLRCRHSAQNVLSSALHQQRRRRLDVGVMDISSRPASPCFVFHAAAVASTAATENGHKSHLSIPVTGHALQHHDNDNDDDWEMERAFDYVALEEGTNFLNEEDEEHHTALADMPNVLALYAEQLENSESEVLVLGNSASAAIGNHQTMESFLRSIVLACGLEFRDDHHGAVVAANNDNAYRLDERQLQLIRDRVQDSERKTIGLLDEIGLQLGCVQSQLQELSRNARSSKDEEEANLDFKNVPALRKCDEQSLETASSMLRLLRGLTRDYHTLLLKSSSATTTTTTTHDTRFLHHVIENLWEGFFQMAKGMMDAMDEYHQQLSDLSNRDVVPQMFVSASHRRAYRALLEKKLRCVSTYYSQLQQVKEGNNSSTTLAVDGASFLRVIYTMDSFCDMTETISTNHDDDDDDDDSQMELDEIWGSATHQLISCASTCFRTYLSDIQNEHQSRREKLDALQLRFFQMIKALYNDITAKHRLAEKDMQRWQELVNQYIMLQKRRREGESDTATDTSEATKQGLFQRITRVIFRLWSHTHGIYCRVQKSNKESNPTMPIELKQWMTDGRQDHYMPVRNRQPDESCSGGGGKRRITCILAGFIYRWLVDRCEEWNAELAEAELLTAVESASLMDGGREQSTATTTTTTSNKPARAGKKTRRRRGEKKGSTPESNATAATTSATIGLDIAEPNDNDDAHSKHSESSHVLLVEPQAHVVASTTKTVSRGDINSSSNTQDCCTNGALVDTTKFENDAEPQLQVSGVSSGEIVDNNDHSNPDLLDDPKSCCQPFTENYDVVSSILIVDEFGAAESAEDFLVGRLLEVLNGTEPYAYL